MKNRASDAMSRRPVGALCPSPMDLPDDNTAMVTHLSPDAHADVLSLIRWQGRWPMMLRRATWCAAGLESLQSVTWGSFREAMSSSDDMCTFEEMAADSFPESRAGMPVAIRGFHQYREDITSADGVVLYKDRVVIPPSLHGDVLSALHAAHQGVSMMTAHAESSVFWPGMSADMPGQTPCHLRRAFATYGTPEELASDGGPELTSTETRSFLPHPHGWHLGGTHQTPPTSRGGGLCPRTEPDGTSP